jgi:hypothetical protein
MIRRVLLLMALCLSIASLALAQEFRGSIAGQVTDPSGAVLPGVQIVATNVATNTSTIAVSDDSGSYKLTYLTPGTYNIVAELPGFKKAERQGVEVRVADQLTLDIRLEVGEVQQTVTVNAQAPLLETSTASTGQVIDQKRISELPLSDGNPFVLARLAPGVGYTGDLKFSRPFDNSGTAALVSDGSPGKNEFTLDGSPNMASGGGTGGAGRVAFVPPADAVQEFKVQTATFDAQQGHTSGATVNVMLKSGSNKLHGTLYEFVRNDKLSANDFFLNRSGRPRAPLRYNRYGGTVGGPIWIPKIYNGHDKTFFFFAYEGIKDQFPEPGLFTVPSEAERRGDFSALLPLGITIYDPLTAKPAAGGRIQRSPFPGNIIPDNRISPIAKAYLKYYPAPNVPGDAQGRNNFIGPNGRGDTFHSESYRFDHQLTEKQQMFFRYTHNNRIENRGNWTGVVSGIRPTGNFLFRINNGGTFDHVYTVSPTTILNYRVGFSRFNEPSVRQHQGLFDPASLGFSAKTAALFGGASYFPRFEISNDAFSLLGDSVGDLSTYNIYSAQPTLTRLHANHSVKLGYDLRSYRENAYPSRHQAGRYDFGSSFTRGPLDNATSAPIGQGLAALLLGQPTGGFMDRNASRANQTLYHGLFMQDDWKVSDRLTLNLGLRWELEGATTERYDRNVRGFDFTSPNPLEQAARAAYAANPIAELSPENFRVRGGLLFANEGETAKRGFWNTNGNNFQPRAGLAYRIGGSTVLRAGWAVYAIPFIIDGTQQPGFSQATNIVPSLDSGLTFRANLSDPFPDGVATPPGSSQGLATFVGRDIEFVPLDRKLGKTQRWELGMQREFRRNWLVEAGYIGTRGYDLTLTSDIINAVPRQYLSTNNSQRDTAVINFLTQNVRNPFQGLGLRDTSLTSSANVSRQQLLRPYPEFGRIRSRTTDGSTIYHSAQVRVEKRFSRGYTLLSSYTLSKLIEEVTYRNETDTQPEKRISQGDMPHRLVMSGIWELPFGRGRALGSDWNGLVDGILGGWQLQGIWQTQSGRPLDLGNLVYFGDPSKLKSNYDNVDKVFDTSGFYFTDAAVQRNGVVDPALQRTDSRIQLSSNIRTFPSRLSGLRTQPLNLWDLSIIKNFSVTERAKIQLRGEFLNAFNHPQFEDPSRSPSSSDFGKTTGQTNLPRNVQVGLKIIF